MKYQKKPIIVEAIQASTAIKAAQRNWKALPEWLQSAYEAGHIIFTDHAISIQTLEGRMDAMPSDYLICGIQGEIYPCKPDIFEAIYEQVED